MPGPTERYGGLGGLGGFFAGGAEVLDGDRRMLPSNSRVFLQSLFGRDDPITDEDFSARELAIIEALARNAGEGGAVTYDTYGEIRPIQGDPVGADYWTLFDPDPGGTALGGLQDKLTGNTAPSQSVMTTLGQFQATPEGDGYRIKDQYNFNTNYPTREEAQEDFFDRLKGFRPWRLDDEFSGPYSLARAAGEAFGPRGMRAFGGSDDAGIPVDFYLGPQDFGR